MDLLNDLNISIGGDRLVPFINIVYNGQEYNTLSFLTDSGILALIHYARDLVGAFLIGNTLIDIIFGIPDILCGKYRFGNTEYVEEKT